MFLHWEWLRNNLDDPVEAKSFAAVKIAVNEDVLTRVYDRSAEGERDAINIALYPLALAIAENWWRLLYEPRKSEEESGAAELRHSLDSWMNGFVFPAVTLWSGGDDVIIIEQPKIRPQHSNLEFLPSDISGTNLPRPDVEENLFELVQAVLGRISKNDSAALEAAWKRVLESLSDIDEKRYCEAAGRLGVDPYDPDSEDISQFAQKLSDRLFANICEAARLTELSEAIEWAKEGVRRLSEFPDIDIAHFGEMPTRNIRSKIWDHGYEAARIVRRNLHLDGLNPRRVVDQIFGAAVAAEGIAGKHPFALEAIANRRDGRIRVVVPRTTARQRRFKLCRASYLAWRYVEGESSAVTTASTLDQQASRAFAAELLAPEELLREIAGSDGLTAEKIDAFAEESVCPEAAIIWQAYNHGIPLRGVALPRANST